MLILSDTARASFKKRCIEEHPYEDENAERKEYGNDLHEVSLLVKHGVNNALELPQGCERSDLHIL